jgi:hypothetical protein
MGDNKYIRVVIYSLMAAFFLSLFSLLALYTACLPWPDLCNVPNAWTLAAIAPILLVLLGVGSAYRAKALKAARGRTTARPVEFGNFSWQLPSIFPSYGNPEKIDMLDETTRGWRVPFDNGIKVNVYKQVLYNWLIDCYEKQRRLSRRESAISRRNNPKLELSQYQARLWLIDKAGAVIRNSTAPNSTPFLREYSGMDPPAASWHIIEEIEEKYEPSVMIF